ncbi:carbonic anhydrase 2-like [Limulus polyphemus]|uniref:Carbonic anhydrase n=1 Tax=Limulus polyphemus TaxID=6850 RepID=A0ABM1S724_LIMPO|nr:carbonic anhydrase 2-like [Limulus polyphemus]
MTLISTSLGSVGIFVSREVTGPGGNHMFGIEYLNLRRSDWPENWPETCKGKKQSPINIDDSEVKINKNLRDIKFVNYDKVLNNPVLVNNGHSVKLDIEDDSNVPKIQDGGLKAEYKFQQLHFHWGSENTTGSEHTLNNKIYPMEMHLVHYNSKYEKDEAHNYEDGLAVLAVFIKIDANDNNAFSAFSQNLKFVYGNDSYDISSSDLTLQALLPKDSLYYRYQGSLTTPPCNETVIWTVFANPVTIGIEQIKEFRNESLDDLVNNFRPIQNLNDRTVEKSYNSGIQQLPQVVIVLASFVVVGSW